MERYDVSEGARLAEMVSAAEDGHEVIITASGQDVARVVAAPSSGAIAAQSADGAADLSALERVRADVPAAALGLDWSGELRAMRDEDRF